MTQRLFFGGHVPRIVVGYKHIYIYAHGDLTSIILVLSMRPGQVWAGVLTSPGDSEARMIIWVRRRLPAVSCGPKIPRLCSRRWGKGLGGWRRVGLEGHWGSVGGFLNEPGAITLRSSLENMCAVWGMCGKYAQGRRCVCSW